MERRAFLHSTAAGAAASVVGCQTGRTNSHQPNIVVMLCDDLGYGDLQNYGHPHILTPNLNKLAGDGVRLTDCYAAAPVCSPARAGMLTGRTPNRCGVYDWIPGKSPMHLPAEEVTIAKLLQGAGYQTCHAGKWHCNGFFNDAQHPQPGDHGFDHWFSTQNNATPSHHNPKNFVRNGEPVGPLEGYSSPIIADEAVQWLSTRNADAPFALFVWFHSPHEPVASAEEFVEPYREAAESEKQAEYFGNVAQTDAAVGTILQALDNTNLRDDTLVLFTSDNGPETLNRYPNASRSWGSPGSLRGMKLHMYEGGIRVPGIVRWPGVVPAGTESNEPFCGTDLLPTLCGITGTDIPNDRPIDGSDARAAWLGQRVEREMPLYWQYYNALGGPKVAMRDGDWKILAHCSHNELFGTGFSRANVNATMQRILDMQPESYELYNLRDDMAETRDRSADEPERLQRMASQLRATYAAVQSEGPRWSV